MTDYQQAHPITRRIMMLVSTYHTECTIDNSDPESPFNRTLNDESCISLNTSHASISSRTLVHDVPSSRPGEPESVVELRWGKNEAVTDGEVSKAKKAVSVTVPHSGLFGIPEARVLPHDDSLCPIVELEVVGPDGGRRYHTAAAVDIRGPISDKQELLCTGHLHLTNTTTLVVVVYQLPLGFVQDHAHAKVVARLAFDTIMLYTEHVAQWEKKRLRRNFEASMQTLMDAEEAHEAALAVKDRRIYELEKRIGQLERQGRRGSASPMTTPRGKGAATPPLSPQSAVTLSPPDRSPSAPPPSSTAATPPPVFTRMVHADEDAPEPSARADTATPVELNSPEKTTEVRKEQTSESERRARPVAGKGTPVSGVVPPIAAREIPRQDDCADDDEDDEGDALLPPEVRRDVAIQERDHQIAVLRGQLNAMHSARRVEAAALKSAISRNREEEQRRRWHQQQEVHRWSSETRKPTYSPRAGGASVSSAGGSRSGSQGVSTASTRARTGAAATAYLGSTSPSMRSGNASPRAGITPATSRGTSPATRGTSPSVRAVSPTARTNGTLSRSGSVASLDEAEAAKRAHRARMLDDADRRLRAKRDAMTKREANLPLKSVTPRGAGAPIPAPTTRSLYGDDLPARQPSDRPPWLANSRAAPPQSSSGAASQDASRSASAVRVSTRSPNASRDNSPSGRMGGGVRRQVSSSGQVSRLHGMEINAYETQRRLSPARRADHSVIAPTSLGRTSPMRLAKAYVAQPRWHH